jgi:hypothetical protein
MVEIRRGPDGFLTHACEEELLAEVERLHEALEHLPATVLHDEQGAAWWRAWAAPALNPDRR